MKTDRGLLIAILVLIVLVVWLLVISVNRDKAIDRAIREIAELKATDAQPRAVDGKTPVLGVDYFVTNGRDGRSIQGPIGPGGSRGPQGEPGLSAYDIAVRNGFTGSAQQWLESLKGDRGEEAAEQLLDCIEGHLVKKHEGDAFWQQTNIKCEVISEQHLPDHK